MSYTTEASKNYAEVLDAMGTQVLPEILRNIGLGQFLKDISKVTVETLTASTTTLTLSKIPLGPVILTKSDGSATYLQVGDDDTVASGEFKMASRSLGTITLHADQSGFTFKCYYLGVTKGETADSAMYESLTETFSRN